MYTNKFENGKLPQVKEKIRVIDVLKMIESGGDYLEIIKELRALGKKSIFFDDIKMSKLPSFRFNFLFDGSASNKNITEATGVIYIDVDNHSDYIKGEYVYACWKSVSGTGLGALVKVTGLTLENYSATYDHVSKLIGANSDSGARKATQQTILSYDPDLYFNKESLTVEAVSISELKNSLEKYPKQAQKRRNRFISSQDSRGAYSIVRFNSFHEYFKDSEDDYVAFENDKERVCVPYITKETGVGERNSKMFYYLSQLALLNPGCSRRLLSKTAYSINKAFLKPLQKEEINSLINSIMFRRDTGGLSIIYNKERRVIFNPDKSFTRSDKMKIVAKVNGKIRRDKKETLIYNCIESWDFQKFGKITQEKMSEVLNISTVTLSFYWKSFKSFVKELNLQWKNSTIVKKVRKVVAEVVEKLDNTKETIKKAAKSIFKPFSKVFEPVTNLDLEFSEDLPDFDYYPPKQLILRT